MTLSPTEGAPPARHGGLVAWLVIVLAANIAAAAVILYMYWVVNKTFPDASVWSTAIRTTVALANVVFVIAIFKWRRWGFYGFIVSSLVALVTNISIGIGIPQSLVGLIGVLLLYGALNIGGPNKAWPHLK